jgi:hypothetical protein
MEIVIPDSGGAIGKSGTARLRLLQERPTKEDQETFLQNVSRFSFKPMWLYFAGLTHPCAVSLPEFHELSKF